jgi:hypothetical protein
MTKNWMRFLLFLMIFGLLFSSLNLSMKTDNIRWDYLYGLPHDSLDIVFMGNSHNFYAFQPQIIDKILPVKSYVLGIGYENIVLSYYELRELLKYQHPKVIVLETYALDLDDTVPPEPYYYEFIDSGFWDENKAAVAARYLTPGNFYTVFPALRTRIDWNNTRPYVDQFVNQVRSVFSPNAYPLLGATPNSRVITQVNFLAIKTFQADKYKHPNPDIETYLIKFYQLCKDNNIQLILTTTPLAGSPRNKNGNYAPYDVTDFAVQNNIPLIKYDPADFNHLHFVNSDHVNEFGAVKVSAEMALELAKTLDLPVNQGELAHFQALYFSDYSLTHIKNIYLIQLIPAGDSSDLDYRWTVVNSNTEATIVKTDWQKEASFQFPINKNGSYEITVEIRNPVEDYILTGTFSFIRKTG